MPGAKAGFSVTPVPSDSPLSVASVERGGGVSPPAVPLMAIFNRVVR